ncbi:TetR/AcrR family transcriptional regulator [Mycolicibacterium frederiksbergense]|uniref:TetR/AcrR family transcriptional regulator n=1 Tax=Mycolicibacterium frederiksbergense TaxID=117567 RepID=A0A6H0SE56_9MYCO|nr:TetR/AcrR family transcriptional regulator [Mycolicibacterium frederiksbergense]QIV84851.1 TetR/AcrR family transcriptional regulator [Mycolicibacterium frederiksbergense]
MAKSTARIPATAEEAESRPARFMKSALEILGETGRTDFTVLAVVERSKTSLRSFYQHYSTKDELLLALVDRIMSESAARWRADLQGLDAISALRTLVARISAPAASTKQDSINRGLTFYNDHLAETLPREYARVLSPLHLLIRDIIAAGITEGVFREASETETDTASALIMQTVLGALRLRVLGAELNGAPVEGSHIFEFCVRSLLRDPGQPI